MPLYTYKCDECNSTWDESHTVEGRKAPETKPCPTCNVLGHVSQIISAGVGFSTTGGRTKTSGMQVPSWYKDKINHLNKDLNLKVSSDIS